MKKPRKVRPLVDVDRIKVLDKFAGLLAGDAIQVGQNEYRLDSEGYFNLVTDGQDIASDLTLTEFIQMLEDTK